ncbi:MAG: type IV toxin-antitoxin system AbiEi family antitoxin [Anaerolineales bacterium]
MTLYSKTLGTENSRLFTALAGQGRIVFSIDEAQKVTGKGYAATQQALLRLTRAGWLVKLGAGKYAIVPPSAGEEAVPEANRLVIARELIGDAPYYISHDSALEVHNMLTRLVTRVTISIPRRLKSRAILKVPYRFVTAKSNDMWGYAPTWVSPGEQVQVSDPERTILDGLARPDLCAGVSEVATGLLIRKDDLDWVKLADYAKRLGSQAVAKRLGYLLEFYSLGTPQVLSSLQELVGPSYALLAPLLPADGRFLARWRLQLNIDPEILKGIAST